MSVQEKSIRLYDTRKTFFSKIGLSFAKMLTPTQTGINNILVSMKRSAVIKNFKAIKAAEAAKNGKEEVFEKKFEESYSLYLESIDQLLLDTIYKKVRNETASEFEKDALSKYYNVIHLKETDETEYKYKKQQYLLKLDWNNISGSKKTKFVEDYKAVYMYEMEQIYKALLKHYSIKLTEKHTEHEKEMAYENIFISLDEYVSGIVPMKKIDDEELVKDCSLYETYEVGKLDQVDDIDKKAILLAISRKLFVHSLPLVVAERCYIKLLKDARQLIVDTQLAKKRESAYQLLLRLMDQYNEKLLDVKIYWNKPEDKKRYNQFNEQRKAIEKSKESKGSHQAEVKKQILYIREDMSYLSEHEDKYSKIMNFYRGKLVDLGDMRVLKNSVKELKGKFQVKKWIRKDIQNEAVC